MSRTTSSAFEHYQRPIRPTGWRSVVRFLFMLGLGGAIGLFSSLILYGAGPLYVAILAVGLAGVLPTLVLKDFRLYWFGVFVFSLQLPISKNLNDGLSVIEALDIDYAIWYFTFEVTITDLVLVVLLLIWINDVLFKNKRLKVPAITWLAVGYLSLSLLSIVGASSPYLGFVELSRQIKFFIIYLFAVNCLETKSAVRVLAVLAVAILVMQGAMTIARFQTGFMTPLSFGETHQEESQIKQYLAVDREDAGAAVRAFGTLGSPGSTLRLCMMVIPFALFLSVPNALLGMRLSFAGLTVFGMVGLLFTFTRVYYITTAIQLALAFPIMIRERLLKREAVVLLVLLGLALAAAVGPKLYEQFTIRLDSVTVRLMQYEASARMILDNPLFGVGLNNATGQKERYVDVSYNEYDPDSQFYLEPTHNLYLNLASEIGILGAILFVAFFANVTLVAWRRLRHSGDPQIRLVAGVLLVVFVSVAINSLIDPLHEYPVLVMLWLYAGLTLNLERMEDAPTGAETRGVARTRPGRPGLARSAAEARG